jgi:hypothetical protein
MEGNYVITKELLRANGACDSGLKEFKAEFPDGAEYQVILDRCAEKGEMSYGEWLIQTFGKNYEIREYENIDDASINIIFAGTVKFKFGAIIKSIFAGDGIKAGDDYGIFAGLYVKLSLHKTHAKITAKEKPKNIVSGY